MTSPSRVYLFSYRFLFLSQITARFAHKQETDLLSYALFCAIWPSFFFSLDGCAARIYTL